jgi:hypothetical protein
MNAKEELTRLLMESYDRGVADATQAALESLSAQPAPVQEPVAWLENLKRLASICPELNMVNYSEEDVDDLNCWAIEVATCIDSITTSPAAQPTTEKSLVVQQETDWKAEYLKSVESGCTTLDELREVRAELEATNRQVEILSDALAESRREVAALKAVQEPVGAIILGGVIDTSDGPEYEEWDVEWNTKAVETLQKKLVTSNGVTLMLYTAPPAAQRTWVGSGDLEDSNAYLNPPAAPIPSEAQIALLDPWMRPAAAKELLTKVLALSQPAPVQEPLEYWNAVEGWVKIDEVREHFDSVGCGTIYKTAGEDRVPVYTAPPEAQRTWVGLTHQKTKDCMQAWDGNDAYVLCRAIEQALKELNT